MQHTCLFEDIRHPTSATLARNGCASRGATRLRCMRNRYIDAYAWRIRNRYAAHTRRASCGARFSTRVKRGARTSAAYAANLLRRYANAAYLLRMRRIANICCVCGHIEERANICCVCGVSAAYAACLLRRGGARTSVAYTGISVASLRAAAVARSLPN